MSGVKNSEILLERVINDKNLFVNKHNTWEFEHYFIKISYILMYRERMMMMHGKDILKMVHSSYCE